MKTCFLLLLLLIGGKWSMSQDNPPAVNFAFDKAKELTIEWNQAINDRNYEWMKKLYADSARVYGSLQSRESIINGKQAWFEAHPDYRQEIVNYYIDCMLFSPDNPDLVRAEFTKIGRESGKEAQYAGILEFLKVGDSYLIIRETDVLTQKNLSRKKQGVALENGKYCFQEEVWKDVRGSGLGHTGPIRSTRTLSFEIKDRKIVNGLITTYSGFISMFQEYEIVQGLQNSGNDLVLEIQYLDITSGEPAGKPSTVKVKVISENEVYFLDDTASAWKDIAMDGGECD